MSFILLPAVDVANGLAVRLVQGDAERETIYGSPQDAALAWQADGAQWIHLVDLDSAFGRGSNAQLLADVIGELDINVELSGGICDDATLDQALATGCARVVLGTAAIEHPAWCANVIKTHGERVAIALDVRVDKDSHGARQHRLAARGWTRDVGDLWDTLTMLDRMGCARYVVTDITQDGTLRGPNQDLYREVTAHTPAQIIASGGVSSIEDLMLLSKSAAARRNLEGAIIGKALYAGRFTLPAALTAVA